MWCSNFFTRIIYNALGNDCSAGVGASTVGSVREASEVMKSQQEGIRINGMVNTMLSEEMHKIAEVMAQKTEAMTRITDDLFAGEDKLKSFAAAQMRVNTHLYHELLRLALTQKMAMLQRRAKMGPLAISDLPHKFREALDRKLESKMGEKGELYKAIVEQELPLLLNPRMVYKAGKAALEVMLLADIPVVEERCEIYELEPLAIQYEDVCISASRQHTDNIMLVKCKGSQFVWNKLTLSECTQIPGWGHLCPSNSGGRGVKPGWLREARDGELKSLLVETPEKMNMDKTLCESTPEAIEVGDQQYLITKEVTVAKVRTTVEPFRSEYDYGGESRAIPGQIIQLQCEQQLGVISKARKDKAIYGDTPDNKTEAVKIFGGRSMRKCSNAALKGDAILRIFDNETMAVYSEGNNNVAQLASELKENMAEVSKKWKDSTWKEKIAKSEQVIKKLGVKAVSSGISTDKHLSKMHEYMAKMTTEDPLDFWEKWILRIGLTVTFLLSLANLVVMIGCAYGAKAGGRIPIRRLRLAETIRKGDKQDYEPTAPPLLSEPPGYKSGVGQVDYREIARNPHEEMDNNELDLFRVWRQRMPDADTGELTGWILNVTRANGIWYKDKVMRNVVYKV